MVGLWRVINGKISLRLSQLCYHALMAHADISYTNTFREIAAEFDDAADSGQLATCIPELAKVDPEKFGVHLATLQQHCGFGGTDEKRSIQSIAKVFSLALALRISGRDLWRRLGVEPSGPAFNSWVQLEY